MPVQVPSDAVCLQCKYRLYGLTEPRCPECGRAFDPANSATYLASSTPRWAQRAQPPHEAMSLLIIGLAILSLVDASKPYPFALPGACFSVVIGGIALTDWLVRGAAWIDSMRHKLEPRFRSESRPGWHWGVLPFCLVLVVSTHIINWPLQLRFRLSLPAFEKAAAEIVHGENFVAGGRWVGLYRVCATRVSRTGNITFSIGHRGFFPDDAGFLFTPSSQTSSEYSADYLMRNWWTYMD